MRWLLFSLLFFHLTAQADPTDPALKSGRQALDSFLSDLSTLQADFTQTVYDQENGRRGIATGVLKLKRPDRFRWDYQMPEQRLILADGRDLWIVENDLEQISQYYQSSALKNTPASVLLAGESLEQSFNPIERGEYQGLQWLELQPHDQDSDVESIVLGFADDQLSQLELTDKFGQVTQFRFSALQRNPVLTGEAFVFNPPEGWDVFAH